MVGGTSERIRLDCIRRGESMTANLKLHEFSIPVNPNNPGHYFACCGILYMADRVFDVATGHFNDGCFVLQTNHDGNPLEYMIKQISMLEIKNVNETNESPIELKNENVKIYLDFWDHFDDRPKIKLFAGREKSKEIIDRWQEELKKVEIEGANIFKISTKNLPSGFDTSTAWNSLDVGFSLNEHKKMKDNMTSYPVVEFFAHIGAQMFGYSIREHRYYYQVWKHPLPIQTAMAVAAGAIELAHTQLFMSNTKKSGQKQVFIPAKRYLVNYE